MLNGDSGFWVQGSGFKVQGSGFKVPGSRFKVPGSWKLRGFPCLLTDIMNSPPASRLRRDRLSLLRKEG